MMLKLSHNIYFNMQILFFIPMFIESFNYFKEMKMLQVVQREHVSTMASFEKVPKMGCTADIDVHDNQFCNILAPRIYTKPSLVVSCNLPPFCRSCNFENQTINKQLTRLFVNIIMLFCATLTSAGSIYFHPYIYSCYYSSIAYDIMSRKQQTMLALMACHINQIILRQQRGKSFL